MSETVMEPEVGGHVASLRAILESNGIQLESIRLALSEDRESIRRHGLRYMQIGGAEGIDTQVEAERMADLCLASLRKPLIRWVSGGHILVYDHPRMRNSVGICY